MVTETLYADNQPIVKFSSLLTTKTNEMAYRKKHIHCSKNFQDQTNYILPTTTINKHFTVYHQNIRGLRDKTSELIGAILPKLPHVICLMEHHLKKQEIENLSIDHYTFGSKFCRQKLKHGGTCIFVHESLAFTNTDLKNFCIEQDIEICAIKINLPTAFIYIICIYRPPAGNFSHFIKGIDTILNRLYKPNMEIISCCDTNINYLMKIVTKENNWMPYLLHAI